MQISIIIPALNEQAKIAQDIQDAINFLSSQNLTGEIIVVDDGSTDNTSQAASQVSTPENATLKVITFPKNKGKGAAVKAGFLGSTGKFVMFADAGSCVPLEDALPGFEMIKDNKCQIVHGSRRHPQTVINRAQTFFRRMTSLAFRKIAHVLIGVPKNLSDTQCGFKLYKGDIARELYSELQTEGFVFDIEIILRAKKAGYAVNEIPIHWTMDPDTRVSASRNSVAILKEMFRIKKIVNK